MINNTADHMTSANYRRPCQVSPSLAPPCSRRGSRSGGGSVRGPAGSLSEALAGTTGPVHCAGRADGLGPQSATCSPGFRDAPRFARVARVFPGAAPCRTETLTLASPAPPWYWTRVDGLNCPRHASVERNSPSSSRASPQAHRRSRARHQGSIRLPSSRSTTDLITLG